MENLEQIKKAVENAIGNNKIEGYTVTTEEKNLILEILSKYQENARNVTIDYLLENSQLMSETKGENKNVKQK